MADAKAFGEQNPSQGETAVSWQTWSDGAGSVPTITGDPDWGKLTLTLSPGEEGRSAVYDLGSAVARTFTLTENRYGTGSEDATLQIRGDTSSFLQDDIAPAWETYAAPISRTWRYVQVRETTNPFDLPMKVSANGRYLVDQASNPVLLISDSPQGMLVSISTADMETYFATRYVQGFNAAQVHVTCGSNFGGGANYETYDGVHPFTVDGDISTPNNTYFTRLDTLLRTANKYGITVFLNVPNYYEDKDGEEALFIANGNTKCYNYGVYLGNRYKNFPNIVWMGGNDWQDHASNANSRSAALNIMAGIASVDSNHTLYTMWLDYPGPSATRENSAFDSQCNLDMAYSYYVMYDIIATEYARSPAKPVFLGESGYEEGSYYWSAGLPYYIRKQNYGAMLAGACGITYMNNDWAFPANWDDDLNLQGALEIAYFKALFEAYSWWLTVPDTTHTLLTNGYATWASGSTLPEDNDFAYARFNSSLAFIYMSTNRTMSVDMSEFSGTVTCRWFDPTNGTYTTDAASPHANSGSHDFSRAVNNSAGDGDWVLVLSV